MFRGELIEITVAFVGTVRAVPSNMVAEFSRSFSGRLLRVLAPKNYQ